MADDLEEDEFSRNRRIDGDELDLSLSLNSSNHSSPPSPPPPQLHRPQSPPIMAAPPPVAVVPPFQEWPLTGTHFLPYYAPSPFYVDPTMNFPQPNQFSPMAGGGEAPLISPPPADHVGGFGFGQYYRPPPRTQPPRRSRTRQPRFTQPPNNNDGNNNNNSQTVPAPYPWATDRRATIRQFNDLLQNGINKITGLVKCKNCLQQYEMELDLVEKFHQVGNYLAQNMDSMHDRAPGKWRNPVLPTCRICNQENSMKPIIMTGHDLDSINWLFLLLGEMIGLCTLEQLKYLCKNTNTHRTGAKDRLLYQAYLTLCHQLDPNGPFHR